MAPDHHLIILHDPSDQETAVRIAAAFAAQQITAELEQLPTVDWVTPKVAPRPLYIPAGDLVVLVYSSARLDWDMLKKERDDTYLVVADLTGGVGVGSKRGERISFPRDVTSIVPIREIESGLLGLVTVVEQLLGLPRFLASLKSGGGIAAPPSLSSVLIIHHPQNEDVAVRLRDDLVSARLEVTHFASLSPSRPIQISADVYLCLVTSTNIEWLHQLQSIPNVIVLTIGEIEIVDRLAEFSVTTLDFTDYVSGRASLMWFLSSRFSFMPPPGMLHPELAPTSDIDRVADGDDPPTAPRRRSVGTQTGAGNDRVAQTDALEFRHYVRAFVDLIESPHTRPPLTIGIYGSWGMGKSFLLEHVTARIRENQKARATAAKKAPKLADDTPRTPDVYVVGFNAWEYSATDVIWHGLVRKIMDTMEREVSSGWSRRQRSKLRRNFVRRLKEAAPRIVVTAVVLTGVLAGVFWSNRFNLQSAALTFSAVGLAGLAKVVVSTLKAPLSQWVTALFQDGDYGRQIGHMAEIRLDLELLETLLRQENGRMVVAIDDLDRCEPEKAVEMLQAINLLLNFESFIVMMGVDAHIVTRAIEKHYKELLGPAGASGYEYLDKIVQIPFRIPEPEPATIRTFLHAQLVGREGPGSTGARPGESRSAESLQTANSGHVGRAAKGSDVPDDDLPASVPKLDQLVGDHGAVVPDTVRKAETPAAEGPPPLPTAFSMDEVEAFEAAADFLKPNPRHIKRLLNVYRLVRTLAHLRSEDTILLNPAATLRWLITTSQWPYAAHAILTHFADMEDRGAALPAGDPLPELLEHVRPLLDAAKTAQLDHDHDVLEELLKSGYGYATSDELKVIRRYTVNFNPAVEREFVLSIQKQTVLKNGDTPSAGERKPAASRQKSKRLVKVRADTPGGNGKATEPAAKFEQQSSQ